MLVPMGSSVDLLGSPIGGHFGRCQGRKQSSLRLHQLLQPPSCPRLSRASTSCFVRRSKDDRGREGSSPPLPPNRAGSSPAHGSPVVGFLIGGVSLDSGLWIM